MENLSVHEAKQYSPLTLAFLGDSVYELWIRNTLVKTANMQASKFNRNKVIYVCAEFQSKASDKLMSMFNEDELAIFQRGKNSKVTAPKHATIIEYKKATALEAVLGFLYLSGQNSRIDEILSYIWENK